MILILQIAIGILVGFLFIAFMPLILELVKISMRLVLGIFVLFLIVLMIFNIDTVIDSLIFQNPLFWLFTPPLVIIGLYIGLAFLLDKSEKK